MKRKLIVGPWDQGTKKTFKDLFEVVLHSNKAETWWDHSNVLLFEGGTDVNPILYGEFRGTHTQRADIIRDEVEVRMFETAEQKGMAMIGVCRGAQFLSVMNGGKLHQHIEGHCKTHHVTILQEHAEKFNIGELQVTSTHHQAMIPTDKAEIIALSQEDGIHEILWYPETKCLCIQGHPEYLSNEHEFPQFCRQLVKELILK